MKYTIYFFLLFILWGASALDVFSMQGPVDSPLSSDISDDDSDILSIEEEEEPAEENEETQSEEDTSPQRYHQDTETHADIENSLEELKKSYTDYFYYFIQPQLDNDKGSRKNNPILFKIHSNTKDTLAEEVALSTSYAAIFCQGQPADKWVSFTSFAHKDASKWRRLGFGLLGSAGDIRAVTITVTTDCGSIYEKICLKTACQSGLCGYPGLKNLGVVCGLCHAKGNENPLYDSQTRACQKDYMDAFTLKIGSHDFNKQKRETQAKQAQRPLQNPSYYSYGRSSPPVAPTVSRRAFYNNPSYGGYYNRNWSPAPTWSWGQNPQSFYSPSYTQWTLPPSSTWPSPYGFYGR